MIELLVVISIIALLAAILFPVLTGTREDARKAHCLSNLRQLGMAFAQYASDNDQMYPLPGSADEYDLDQSAPYWDLVPTKGNAGTLNPYIFSRTSGKSPGMSVWVCPSMPEYHETDITPAGTTVSFNEVTERTYTMNWYLRDPSPDPAGNLIAPDTIENPDPATAAGLFIEMGRLKEPLNTARLIEPAQTILLFEGVPVVGGNIFSSYFGSSRRSGDFSFEKGYMPSAKTTKHVYDAQGIKTDAWTNQGAWHKERNNRLFCDGHVKSAKPSPYPWVPSSNENLWYVARYR